MLYLSVPHFETNPVSRCVLRLQERATKANERYDPRAVSSACFFDSMYSPARARNATWSQNAVGAISNGSRRRKGDEDFFSDPQLSSSYFLWAQACRSYAKPFASDAKVDQKCCAEAMLRGLSVFEAFTVVWTKWESLKWGVARRMVMFWNDWFANVSMLLDCQLSHALGHSVSRICWICWRCSLGTVCTNWLTAHNLWWLNGGSSFTIRLALKSTCWLNPDAVCLVLLVHV